MSNKLYTFFLQNIYPLFLKTLEFLFIFFISASLIYILLKYIKIGAYMHTILFPLPHSTPTPPLLPMLHLVVDINLFVDAYHSL